MEAATALNSSLGASNDATLPSAFDEDLRFGHSAVTASQSPTPAGSILSTGLSANTSLSELHWKETKSSNQQTQEQSYEQDSSARQLRSSRARISKSEDLSTMNQEQNKPLQLLDLPVDVLKEIVKEVTHTNDLTSLALCHSALHRLAVPHIYSRFDIVWPDMNTHAEPRSGVDALTYGLATLVMAEEVFGEAASQQKEQSNRFLASGKGRATETAIRRRRGNHYAQFTKKFSLGNGPADWVQEYLITKEGGKMLGTLVALAVARMRALEAFIWDMPTGILRDVWLALSSLGDDGKDCRLEKLWVRFHNNSAADAASPVPPPPPPLNLSNVNPSLRSANVQLGNATAVQINPAALDRVEHPSFSILPPMKSLSVLDVDELPYLDEMAVLIGNSRQKLRELRVGIAQHAASRKWVKILDSALQQVDYAYPTAACLTIGEKRLGGVLGVLAGFVHDMRDPPVTLSERPKTVQMVAQKNTAVAESTRSPHASDSSRMDRIDSGIGDPQRSPATKDDEPESSLSYPTTSPIEADMPLDERFRNTPQTRATSTLHSPISRPTSQGSGSEAASANSSDETSQPLSHQLHLENLELERVPLSVLILQTAFDWTSLTSLTLLSCQNHEQLWKILRRDFAPTPKSPTYPLARRRPSSTPRKPNRASTSANDVEFDYKLKLKKVHTNTVSSALISFLKETLAPNSLEELFLQDSSSSYTSTVLVDAIYRGPIKRHRSSLKKLLIDSCESSSLLANTNSWRKWMFKRDILAFVCSGKMPALRELGVAIEYRDLHFLLQSLPQISQLRSLYIPYFADPVHEIIDLRELALQFVDIVALRPEVELCYMGLENKCFEILENRREVEVRSESQAENLHGNQQVDSAESEDEEADDDEQQQDEDDEEQDTESDEEDNDNDDDDLTDSDSDCDSDYASQGGLRIREILFYDDKVAIFKARHGRL